MAGRVLFVVACLVGVGLVKAGVAGLVVASYVMLCCGSTGAVRLGVVC